MALELRFTEEDEAFRAEVRAFLESHLSEDLREPVRRQTSVFPEKDVALRWQRLLHRERGWAAPAWPEEFGGPGWNATRRYIFDQECARAGAPALIPLGTRMLAPVLFRYGTPEQQQRFLPPMLAGEHYWCQGYSEPGSGSDLAGLQTRAVRDGDDYIVDGTKIWTTHAHYADHIFALVRTSTEGRPQAGISFLLIDMDSPGISVRPIVTIAGEHEVNQVFLEGVRVPVTNRVGPENEGWTVAKYLLEYERGGGVAPSLTQGLAGLKCVAEEVEVDGTPLLRQPEFAARVSQLEIGIRALEFVELRTLSRLERGDSPGPESSLQKNASVELEQTLDTLMLEAAHYYAMPHHPRLRQEDGNAATVGPPELEPAVGRYLNSRAASIFGGSREVQKNIIARAVLGL
jgi:acyl-CoA dehydrogenase